MALFKRAPFLSCLVLLISAAALLGGCGPSDDSAGRVDDLASLEDARIAATEPEAVAETFRVLDGFEMQLLAAEPLVTDPVALAYDENGLAYAAEMRDYPYADPETARDWAEQRNQAPLGRIRVLRDTNRDGRPDTSVIFADSLSWPTGIAVWKGGVFVTAAPHIWYLKDTDDDHRADIRRRVYTGFRKYNIQATINNLRFGLDHKIYGAGSTNGGSITTVGDSTADPVELSRNDFRFDPTSSKFERLTGAGRYGHTFDNEGNRFIASPYQPFMHVVVPYRYLERNTHVQIESALNQVADVNDDTRVYKISPPQPWRAIRARRRASSSSTSDPDRGFGHWTGASGSMLFRGNAYPARYSENIFIGEVANNVIHRRTMTPDGVSFRSARADSGAEFVASTDTWFRPVNMTNAPDGTLHILDMYREFIEHPWSLPDDIHARLDLTSGKDRGRIYRLTPPGFNAPDPPRLGSVSTDSLVSLLAHSSSWWRTTAHRLLYERQDQSAVPALRRMLRDGDMPAGRIRSLWSLKGLGALRETDLVAALEDRSAAVRRSAIELAEERMDTSDQVLNAVLRRTTDSSIRVRYQAALALGGRTDERAVGALADLAARDHENRWLRTAILTARPENGDRLLTEVLSSRTVAVSNGSRELLGNLAAVVGGRNQQRELANLFEATSALPGDREGIRTIVLSGLGSGLAQHNLTLDDVAQSTGGPAENLVAQAIEDARQTVIDTSASSARRATAVHLLGYGTSEHDWTGQFASLLAPARPMPVQEAALRVVGRSTDPAAIQMLLDRWETLTPLIQDQAMGVFMQKPGRVSALLDAIEAGQIALQQVSSTARSQLLSYRDSTLQNRAERLLERTSESSRSTVVARYREQLAPSEGSPAEGRKIYQTHCSSCHTFQDMGTALGPPLETVQDKNPEELLIQIFDPGREITPGYGLYLLELDDGRTLQGTITGESPTGITLKQPGGVVRTVLRKNIASLSNTGRTPMPEGLERVLSPAAVNDLLAFLLDT